MTAIARGFRVAAVLLLPALPASPARAAAPTLVLQMYVNESCEAPHCESETDVFLCTAEFRSPNVTDVGINTSVACYAEEYGVQVAPGLVAMVGPAAVNGGAATVVYGGTLCVSGVGMYLSGPRSVPVTAGPICKPSREWPPVTALVPDVGPVAP